MPRDLPIGNGSMLVAFDAQYRLSDFYFPRVGMENQAGAKFRLGVFADGALHATDEAPWQCTLDYLRDTLVTDVTLQNDALGLRLRCYDAVDPDANVYVRRIVVRNQSDELAFDMVFIACSSCRRFSASTRSCLRSAASRDDSSSSSFPISFRDIPRNLRTTICSSRARSFSL